ncbi:DUF1697 domain-containing protein [Nocardioides sp. Soil805]|uniref:DUF1697 domain-containing protein n=1 Tax=Nocardioides sp. Soil805 TaxID=1736416 RepID=UPI0007036B3C|nr:DUF1697 domain-containing protein [Nocardioides sp. Soil805]KRF37802.1 hypothetical protein ASG94_04120 [Nocardioides sp. Soil805]
MPTYVAFLRAINLGATRKFPQDAIRAAVESTGARDVETYINTGNVRLGSSRRSPAKVAADLEEAFAADRGFEVPTVVLTLPELAAIAADAEELADGHDRLGMQYVSLLKQAPTAAQVRDIEAVEVEGERLVVRGRGAHLLLDQRDSYHLARLSNDFVEKRLGVSTSRNVRVIRELASRWG